MANPRMVHGAQGNQAAGALNPIIRATDTDFESEKAE